MKIKSKKGGLALSQIFILIIGIIAVSYAIGSEVRIVSGDLDDPCKFEYGTHTYDVYLK